MPKITTFLAFPKDGDKALDFYCSVFRDSQIHHRQANPETGQLMYASFQLNGTELMAIEAGEHPDFTFTNGISLFISCADQAEVDYYWDALMADGGEPQACGWLKDQFGVRWQVIPNRLMELMTDSDPEKSGRVMAAMMEMIKIDVPTLEAAYLG